MKQHTRAQAEIARMHVEIEHWGGLVVMSWDGRLVRPVVVGRA